MTTFDPEQKQPLVDSLWVMALGLWISEVRSHDRHESSTTRFCRRDLLPLAASLVVFAVAWLPFYDNWRWAWTGDSIAWFTFASAVAKGSFSHNLLSVHGVDDHFTYIHSLASNGLLFVFEPSLWWHRVGKLIVSCLSLTAMYAYFTLILGRWWAAAVVVATAANYVWLWFSYISYGHIDSHIFYFLTLLLATLMWRQPQRLGYWMLCGLVGGWALFFTQASWSAVAAVGLLSCGSALWKRRFIPAAVYVVSFLLAALPILLQLPDFVKMNSEQARVVLDLPYLLRIFTTILRLPYDWNYCRIGVQGAFLRWPLGPLYVVGLATAALAIASPLRRTLRVPAVAPVLLGLLLWDAVLLTLTNNINPQPSTKRVFNLIPLQVFFALLPLYVLSAWSRQRALARRACIAVSVVVLAIYVGGNLRVLMHPVPRAYGYNVFDAMIELRQRLPERRVTLFSSRRDLAAAMVGTESVVNQMYHLKDTVSVNSALTPEELQRVCAAHQFVCYEPNFDVGSLSFMLRTARPCVQPLQLLSTVEAACFECDPASCQRPPTEGEISALLALPRLEMYRTACD